MAALADPLQQLAVDTLRLCAWLAVLAAIFVPLERLFGLHPAKILRGAVAVDLGYYFLSALLPGLLLAVPLACVASAARGAVPDALLGSVAAAPLWARALAAFVIGEVGAYWGHRWTHAIPALWRFHAIHHSAPHMDFLVNTRAHPVDLLFTRLCGLVPLHVLGLGGPAAPDGTVLPFLVVLTGTVWGFWIHANVRLRLGPLEWLVSSPAFHHWHHSRVEHTNRNYASILPVLDRLFGTHHLPRGWPAAYGIEGPLPATLVGQLAAPLRPASAPQPAPAAASASAAVTAPS